jgi:signal transduction histidine kinase
LPSSATAEIARLGLIDALRRTIELEMRGAFDEVTWKIAPAAEEGARELPPTVSEIMFYAAREALRNAARYGRGSSESNGSRRPLHLTISAEQKDGLRLTIGDDGVGLEAGIASQGSGQGLALHSTMMAVIGGSLEVKSEAQSGTRVVLTLPSDIARSEPEAQIKDNAPA